MKDLEGKVGVVTGGGGGIGNAIGEAFLPSFGAALAGVSGGSAARGSGACAGLLRP